MPKNLICVSLYLLLLLLIFLAILIFSMVYFGPGKYQVKKIHGEQFVVFNEGEIRLQVDGIGKHAILFLHGFNGSMNLWDPVWPLLQNCGDQINPNQNHNQNQTNPAPATPVQQVAGNRHPVQLLRIDIPGFGLSEWQPGDFSLETQSRRIIRLLDRLNIDTVTLVGTSMGASLSAVMAAQFPQRVSSLLMMAPSGYPDSLNAGLIGSKIYRPGLVNQLFSDIAASNFYKIIFPDSRILQALSVTASYGTHWTDSLKKISQPTTILWSETDNRIDFKYAKVIQNLISSSRLVLASPQAGHNIAIQDAEFLARQICQLL